MVLKILKTVWPVMLTYVAIGAPCGMIMAQTGMEPWMVFALSSTFVTGCGQFMVCNLWLAGVPAASLVGERRRHLLALRTLLGIDRTASGGRLEASDAGRCRDAHRGGIWHLACQVD